MKNKLTEGLQNAWEENPLMCIAIGVAAVTATAKLIEASSNARRTSAWHKEVDRRMYKTMRA